MKDFEVRKCTFFPSSAHCRLHRDYNTEAWSATTE